MMLHNKKGLTSGPNASIAMPLGSSEGAIERSEQGYPSGYPLKASVRHPKHGAGVVNGWSAYKGDTYYVDYEVGHREGYTLDELMPLLKAALEREEVRR